MRFRSEHSVRHAHESLVRLNERREPPDRDAAHRHADEILLAFPQNWSLDPSGTVRFESLGFGGSGEDWLAAVKKHLESLQS